MACTLAPPAALGFDAAAAAFVDRRWGVAALAPAAAHGVMARDPTRRAGAVVPSAPTKKRSLDGKIKDREGFAAGEVPVIPASGQQRLQQRMRAEIDAIRVLHRKALLLSRGAAPASKDGARLSATGARPRSAAPMEVATKGRKTSNPTPAAAQKSTEPVMKQQEKRPVQSATPPPTKRSVAEAVDKAREALKRRRLEEMARAREKCRQEVIEMERTALPDETIYAEDLQELGIAFQYAVTRTRMQAVRSRLNDGE